MVKYSNLLSSALISFLSQNSSFLLMVNGFSTVSIDGKTNNGSNTNSNSVKRIQTHLDMISTPSSSGQSFDDFNSQRRDNGNGDDSSSSPSSSSSPFSFSSNHHHERQQQKHVQHESTSSSSSTKFVSGDDLHRLRHQVLALRLELQEARRNVDVDEESPSSSEISIRKVQKLERAIMKTQQVDAEFVYTVSLERIELAEQDGDIFNAQRYHELAMEARAALPQFNLEGLWVGKYGDQGYEMVNVTYKGDVLFAHKVTSRTKYVPKNAETFRVDLSPQLVKEGSNSNHNSNRQQYQNDAILSPIELGDSAAEQWGCKYLQRFSGIGHVASEGYQDSRLMDGQLILVNEYFSFAWLPIGHQVFFGRPTPELILKLMKDEKKKEAGGNNSARSFLEKCWEETEHIEDDMEIDIDNNYRNSDQNSDSKYLYQEGCWE